MNKEKFLIMSDSDTKRDINVRVSRWPKVRNKHEKGNIPHNERRWYKSVYQCMSQRISKSKKNKEIFLMSLDRDTKRSFMGEIIVKLS